MRPHRTLVGRGLSELAREQGYDLIVAAMNRHRGMKDRILGSVAEHLILDAPCAVLITRPLLTRVGAGGSVSEQ